jgi:hypothetical protein
MAYNRGSIDDWDRYAQIAKDSSLTWQAMVPYMYKNEKFTLPDTTRNLVSDRRLCYYLLL